MTRKTNRPNDDPLLRDYDSLIAKAKEIEQSELLYKQKAEELDQIKGELLLTINGHMEEMKVDE